jgi:hypothetical protein
VVLLLLAATLSMDVGLVRGAGGESSGEIDWEAGDSRAWAFVFPGLGLLARGASLRGALWAGSGLLAAGFAIHAAKEGDRAYAAYRRADEADAAQRQRRLTERWDRRRDVGIAAFALVWVASVLDTYRAPPGGFLPRPLEPWIGWDPEGGVQLGVVIRW